MKISKMITIAILVITFFSCSSKKTPLVATVKPDKLMISGPLGDYLEVVDNPYEVVENFGANLTIKIKAKSKAFESFLKEKEFDLKASLLDQNGIPTSGIGELSLDYSNVEKIKSLLLTGNGEEVIHFQGFGYNAKKDADRIGKFSISSTLKDQAKQQESSSTPSSSTEDVTDDAGDENYDKMLDDYQAYTDQYIAFWEKAQAGDEAAILEYPGLMEKSIKLSESLKKAQSSKKLSSEQLIRQAKIQGKMLKVMYKTK